MTEHPLVVLGAHGMVGRAWVEMLQELGIRHVAASRDDIDITDAQSVAAGIVEGTPTVVNCAAWANVDAAEEHEEEATQLNGEAVGIVAERCRQVGATLIHYGTDYVFDGNGKRPYEVDCEQAPINAYGRGKSEGERRLRESGADYLLIRTSWVYAPWGKNFVRTMAHLCGSKNELRVVDDQRGRPTSAEGLARQSYALLNKGARGVFHVTDGGDCSWYELAAHVVKLSLPRQRANGVADGKHQCKVDPCSSSEYPTAARRPTSSVLSLKRTESLIGGPASWREAVESVVKRLE